MADRVIFNIRQVVDKACVYTMKGRWYRFNVNWWIVEDTFRASRGAFKIFLWLTVVCENWHFSQILHFVFISAAISMGCKWVREVKNPLRAQSKYGLMGSSAKTVKKFFWGSSEHFLDKNAIWDRTLPPYTSIAVYMCGGGFKGPKSSNGIQLSRFVQKLWHF